GAYGQIMVSGSILATVPETFTILNPSGPFTLNANAGNDTANVQGLTAQATLNMGDGNDVVNVSSDAPANLGTLAGITAPLTVDAGTGTNTLTISDFGATTPTSATLSATTLTGLAPAAITYRASGGNFLGGLNILGADGAADTILITGTLPT